jgi:hypothetical protein
MDDANMETNYSNSLGSYYKKFLYSTELFELDQIQLNLSSQVERNYPNLTSDPK